MWTNYKRQKKNTTIKGTGDSQYIYRDKLDKTCFQHDIAYGDFTDFKVFNIAKNPKYDACQRGFTSMVYKFSGKKTSGGAEKYAKPRIS